MNALCIVPVRDEADALASVLPRLQQEIYRLSDEIDIVVVDDGSTDGSGDVALGCGCRVIKKAPEGKPSAVLAGFQLALGSTYDATIVFDGDGQHPPEAIPGILGLLSNHDVVKGTRFHPESPQVGTPEDRRLLCERVRAAIRRHTAWDITDPQCGLVGIKRGQLSHIVPALSWTKEWELELILYLSSVSQNGCPIKEFPIPALYARLPGAKQAKKYRPELGAERLRERLPRQLEVVEYAAKRFIR